MAAPTGDNSLEGDDQAGASSGERDGWIDVGVEWPVSHRRTIAMNNARATPLETRLSIYAPVERVAYSPERVGEERFVVSRELRLATELLWNWTSLTYITVFRVYLI